MNRDLKIAIAELQRAFKKARLTGLCLAFSAKGAAIGVTIAGDKIEKFETTANAYDTDADDD